VYAREVDGKALTFGVSGALWRDALVMYDRETGSYWSQISGEGIQGKLVGKKLEQVPARVMTWGEWRRLHPDTLVLVKERPITTSDYGDYVDNPEAMGIFGTTNPDSRLGGKEMVLGLQIGGEAIAFPHVDLERASVATATVGGRHVIVAYDADGSGAVAYENDASGMRLTFPAEVENPRSAQDPDTGSTWDLIRGVATAGKMKGTQLREMASLDAYWFAWASFHPDTSIWKQAHPEPAHGGP
jgi:hypothetical protein